MLLIIEEYTLKAKPKPILINIVRRFFNALSNLKDEKSIERMSENPNVSSITIMKNLKIGDLLMKDNTLKKRSVEG